MCRSWQGSLRGRHTSLEIPRECESRVGGSESCALDLLPADGWWRERPTCSRGDDGGGSDALANKSVVGGECSHRETGRGWMRSGG